MFVKLLAHLYWHCIYTQVSMYSTYTCTHGRLDGTWANDLMMLSNGACNSSPMRTHIFSGHVFGLKAIYSELCVRASMPEEWNGGRGMR